MDTFLEEQLKRIRELTRRMSGFEKQSAELTEEIERERQNMRGHPLRDVRDLRTVPQPSRHQANDSPRRRRRKR
jgi:hypothetical protein